MMWIALLIALVLSLAALAFVVWPLLKPGPAPVIIEDDRLTELLGRKDAVMAAIKELEFDYNVGKLSEEDYKLYDGRLRRQAVGLLQQIEQVAPLSAGLDATMEAEVSRRRRVAEPVPAGARQAAAAPVAVASPAPVAAAQASAALAPTAVAAAPVLNGPNGSAKPRFCTNCGNRLEPQHKFCANCGAPASAPIVRVDLRAHGDSCARSFIIKPIAFTARRERMPAVIHAKSYLDPSASVEERVSDLLGQMTLEEKIAQLGSCWVFELLTHMQFDPAKAQALMRSGIGQITRLAGASSLGPTDAAQLANQIQKYVTENTRLRIPALIHEECCSGYMARNATCFPQTIGVACTWEPELAHAMADVVRRQMRAAGAHQGLSPLLDVTRDPRWGRTEETYGEDPYLVARMGVEFVAGLQGSDWKSGVLATGKHFVGYGASEGGMNWAPPHINARELDEVYLFPFEAAVREAGLMSVMNAYHELDGVPCAGSHYLLTELLRQRWGFDGIVVSDYFAINQLFMFHQIVHDKQSAAIKALSAGLDVELPNTDCYGAPLRAAVESGRIDVALVDSSVARHLRMKFMLGLFENPFVDEGRAVEVFDTPDQRQLARRIAQKSIVLLKNDGDLLPLSKSIKSLAVIGPSADSVRNLIGDYAYPCHVESLAEMAAVGGNVFDAPRPESPELADTFVPIKSILQALGERLDPAVKIHYAEGCGIIDPAEADFGAAITAARSAEVAIVVVGDRAGLTVACTTGEARDRAELGLPGVQQELVEAIQATGTPVVVVLINGRPAAIPWIAEYVPAVVEAWLPSEEGADAVVDVLFGDYNPGGKLAITVPRGVGQVPIYYGHKASGGRSEWKIEYVEMSNKPLYPFGYGLSYTTFALDNLRCDQQQVRAGDHITLSLDITNTGPVAGDEVVQLYIRVPNAGVTRPVKELKGFQRVHLKAGERRSVRFVFAVNQCAYRDEAMQLVVEPGPLQVMIGTSSEDLPLHAEFEIVGKAAPVERKGAFFSASEVI